MGSTEAVIEDKAKLSRMCWNVCGWCREGSGMEQMREEHDRRAEVIDFYRTDVEAVVVTWLKGEEEIVVEGYRWFGRNRRRLHSRAVRGQVGLGCWFVKKY